MNIFGWLLIAALIALGITRLCKLVYKNIYKVGCVFFPETTGYNPYSDGASLSAQICSGLVGFTLLILSVVIIIQFYSYSIFDIIAYFIGHIGLLGLILSIFLPQYTIKLLYKIFPSLINKKSDDDY